MGIVEQYLVQLKTEKRRWRRAAAILTVLSVFVAMGVSWNLRMTGITLANDATCGQTEHRHTEECYESLCPLPEHTHVLSCYADTTADLETAKVWEESLPPLSGEWAEDLVLIARSQLGCGESERNFVVAEDGQTRNGITRYGQWYGNPHGDWSGMFMLFCLHYADIPQEVIPRSPGVYNMMRFAQEAGILTLPDENVGAVGNLLFLDMDENGNADAAAIVSAGGEGTVRAIGGDLDDAVKEITLSAAENDILSYIDVRALQHPPLDEAVAAENPEDTAEEIGRGELVQKPALLMNSAMLAATDSVGVHLTPTAGNLWQIVAGGYEGRTETNKQDHGNVRIQKNVVPTDTENEFLVYLSIDKELSWKTVFDYGAYFASSANGNVGETTSLTQGNPQELSTVLTGTHKTPFYMIIQVWDDSRTQLKSETETLVRYTGKGMKNGKILLQIPGTQQAIVVANVKNYEGTSADNPVYIQLTENQLSGGGESGFESISAVDTVLDTVVDEMGEHIEFIEVVAGDYERTPSYSNGTLTWYPKTADIQSQQEEGQTWQQNAAQLVYKIRLKNDKSCGEHLDAACAVGSCEHVYPTNKSAVLTYHMSDAPSTYHTAEFSVPYVRGLLYDIHFIKIDQDTERAIKGAVFTLSKENDPSFSTRTVVSGSNGREGEVSFTDLISGTYTLTETAAPDGYEITFGGPKHSMDIVLSYTAAPDKVMEDIFDPAHTDKLMYKGAVDGLWKITNRYTQVDPMLPSTGGMGTPLYTFCGLILISVPLIYGLNLRRKHERRPPE